MVTVSSHFIPLVCSRNSILTPGSLASNSVNNPTWKRPSDGEEIPMVFPTNEPLEYEAIDTGMTKTLESCRPVVRGILVSTLRDRCNPSKQKNAAKKAAEQKAKGKASNMKTTVWFPGHTLQIKSDMAKYDGRSIKTVNNTNVVECQFVRGKVKLYYD